MDSTLALNEKNNQLYIFKNKIDSITFNEKLGSQIYKELSAQYPLITGAVIQPAVLNSINKQENLWIALIQTENKLSTQDHKRIQAFLSMRLNNENILIRYIP